MEIDGFGNLGEDLDVIADMQVAVTGNLITVTCHLGKSDIPISRTTTLATLTAQEADYDGYAAKAVTFNAGSVSPDLIAETLGICTAFVPTGAVVQNQIFNVWYQNGAGLLICAFRIPVPGVQMAGPTDSYLPVLRLRPRVSARLESID